MAGEIKVRLQHHKDRFEVTLPATSRVSALKQEASRLTSVEPGRQRLICRGKAMGVFPIYDLLQMHNTLSWLEVLDGSLELQTLLPKAGAELTVMLMPMESSGDQARRTWQHYQRVLLAWLRSIWVPRHRATRCSTCALHLHVGGLPCVRPSCTVSSIRS
ncbi:unnamed protein product [Durusdinium trenchii]|uniref:Ubiquitin-like domain-containing protein n=1 Tax=Durusdinium trenchii TaxID=1381693 RepID=A0ABP0NSX1_9DINO